MSSGVWGRKLRRQRVTALIVSLGLAFWIVGCTYEEPDRKRPLPGPAFPVPSTSESEVAVAAREGWGPDALFYTDAGDLYAGENRWLPARVASFTTTSTGVVYVNAETSRLVWADWEHSIRELDWLEPKETRLSRQWGEFQDIRDIVGNPSHDLVSWVHRGAYGGDIVVVRPSTGEALAHAVIPSLAAEKSVVYGSIDDAAVYYAISPGGGATGEVWVWRWAAGEAPQLSDRPVADVSGDIWAVEREDRIDFENADGTVLSSVHSSYGDRTAFGSGLSPGGRFWYAPAHGLIVETATGAAVKIGRGFQQRYGWAGPEELALIGPGISVCSAVSGKCEGPFKSIDMTGDTYHFGLPLN
ncbi:hypothetical protein [Arthrobacter sp. HMWF013]|uniref:hypothetical protein n=1 Tax=Arthrobacter sp. HMWF013 TaxID=2056849 RepID=UPI000D46E2A6|nr:hypothetical protein [Arthrobacter sp. HMWF013]PTT69313.1 hypothetical protein DBR22_04175 [Arthrobacter sp. HMWF013]